MLAGERGKPPLSVCMITIKNTTKVQCFPLSCGCQFHEIVWHNAILLGCPHGRTWFTDLDVKSLKMLAEMYLASLEQATV